MRRRRCSSARGLGALALVGVLGCYSGVSGADGSDDERPETVDDGSGGDDGGDSSGGPNSEPLPEDDPAHLHDRIAETGVRRLTSAEYAATIRDVLGVDIEAELILPEDHREPFDNDYTTQHASKALIDGAELLAQDIAALALDSDRRDETVGCVPAGPTDAGCFADFLQTTGRSLLRRPLTEDELGRYSGLISEAEETGDFHSAVEVALRALLQHPEFLYRIELGTPTPEDENVFELSDYEVATRLSYFLWGSAPDDALLDRADNDGLSAGGDIRAAAEEMLLDPRARARIGRFHAMWLGYESLPHALELSSAMETETQALIDRVIFDDALPWQELLRSEQTFVNDLLAEHYGMPAPEQPGWVDYGDIDRKGLLSHGSFLSAMSKVNDSSPTKRGILVRTRLMCMHIPEPPPTVDVDNTEPEEGTCKEDFYRNQHLGASGCASCHALMDPIGFGLEKYDHTGAFREVENDDPSCEISGDGELDGSPFTGPSELADLLIDSGALNRCVAEQLYRFVAGRSELGDLDQAFIDVVVDANGAEGDFDFTSLVLAFVSDDAFRYRRNETIE